MKNKVNTSPTDAQKLATQNSNPPHTTLENWLLTDIQSIIDTFQEMTKAYLISAIYADKEDDKRESAYLDVEKLGRFLTKIQTKSVGVEVG